MFPSSLFDLAGGRSFLLLQFVKRFSSSTLKLSDWHLFFFWKYTWSLLFILFLHNFTSLQIWYFCQQLLFYKKKKEPLVCGFRTASASVYSVGVRGRYTQLKSVSTRILQNKLLIAYSSSSNTKYTAPIKSIQLLWCFVLLIPFKNQLRSTKFGFLTKVVSVVMVTWWPVIVLDSSWLVTLSEMMAWAKQISTRAKSLPWQWI